MFKVLLFYQLGLSLVTAQNISIWNDDSSEEESNEMDVDLGKCSNLPKQLVHKADSINTHGHCARLYDDWNCTGNSVEISPYSASPNNLKLWGFSEKTLSVSKCRHFCNNLLPKHASEKHFQVTIFNKANFTGSAVTLTINGCTPIVAQFKKFKSVQSIDGNCVQLWRKADCVATHKYFSENLEPDAIELKLENGSLRSDISSMWKLYETSAISSCSYTCNRSAEVLKNERAAFEKFPDMGNYEDVHLNVRWIGAIIIIALFIEQRLRTDRQIELREVIEEFFNGGGGRNTTMNEGETALELVPSSTIEDIQGIEENLRYNQGYEIPTERLTIDRASKLGSGQFGVVYRGTLVQNDYLIQVAIKTLKPNSSIDYLRSLGKEIKIEIKIKRLAFIADLGGHPNIVKIIGCCTESLRKPLRRELYLLLEYCSKGSLEFYLRNHQNSAFSMVNTQPYQNQHLITYRQMLQWMVEISSAMEFLARSNIVHRDLAARNVLLDDNLSTKLSDFGLSRNMYSSCSYIMQSRSGPLPWLWLPLESILYKRFSTHSDVWSFGVLCWEIMTYGKVPFVNMENVEELISRLNSGDRLSKPENCTNECYALLKRCWEIEPMNRPSFKELCLHFSNFFNEFQSNNNSILSSTSTSGASEQSNNLAI